MDNITQSYHCDYNSPIGRLKIVTSNKMLISISFLENADRHYDEKPCLFTKEVTKQLDEYFTGKRKEFNIPIELGGTNFQENVWKNLMTIPFGKTSSYKDIALKINNEKACRAVGNANNKNIIPIVIPCHRVVGSNNKLVGYAGGLWRKEWLLKHENAINQ